MSKTILCIGGKDLCTKAAVRFRHLDEEATVTILEPSPYISWSAETIPAFVAGDISEFAGIFKTSYQSVRDVEFFRKVKHVEVRTGCTVTAIDRTARIVTARVADEDGSERTEEFAYDQLVLGMPASRALPPVADVPGCDGEGCFAVGRIQDAEDIQRMVSSGRVESAVVVGADHGGLEMAEALADLWGIETTLVVNGPHLLPDLLDPEHAKLLTDHLAESGVMVRAGDTVREVLTTEGQVSGVSMAGGQHIACELVLFARTPVPDPAFMELCRRTGLRVGHSGALAVDESLRTSDAYILAGGGSAEAICAVTESACFSPHESLTARQGRVIGGVLAGRVENAPRTVHARMVGAFGFSVARAGLTLAQAAEAGYDPVETFLVAADREHYHPEARKLFLKLMGDRATGRVLGVQVAGENGDAAKARADVAARAIAEHRTAHEMGQVEVCAAPSHTALHDILLLAANALENVMDGITEVMPAREFVQRFLNDEKLTVLDVRDPVHADPYVAKYGPRWVNVLQDDLGERFDELPAAAEGREDVVVFCNSGLRSYEAQRFLAARGKRLINVQGGHQLLTRLDRGFLID